MKRKLHSANAELLMLTLMLESPGTRSALDMGAREATVTISALSAGRSVSVAPNCFGVVASIDPNSDPIELRPPVGTKLANNSPNNICYLLPAGFSATRNQASRGEFIYFEIPKTSIRNFATANTLGERRTLRAPLVLSDNTIQLLSRTIRPFLVPNETIVRSFEDFFVLSVLSHLIDCYGLEDNTPVRFVGGLSPAHRRIVDSAVQAAIAGPISLEEVAKGCGFSGRHFARAFRQSYGVPFHRHLLSVRILRAKELLVGTSLPLRDIAAQTGYADQATFTESFTRFVGTPPGRYRRRFMDSSQTAVENAPPQ